MPAVLGASVDPSQPLVEVADPAALDIVFNVTPPEAGAMQGGDSVTVKAGEGAGGESLGAGGGATVGGAGDSVSRARPGRGRGAPPARPPPPGETGVGRGATAVDAPAGAGAGEGAGGESLGAGMVTTVGAAVDSVSRAVPVRARIARPARPLRIGESVFGRIVTAVHARAVTVPIEALVPAGDGYQVFVVDTAGIAHARPVTVGARSEALAEVVTGLAAGETVVTSGAYGVADGAKIARVAP